MKKGLFIFLAIFSSLAAVAQNLYFKDILKPNRDALYRNLVQNSINKNLSLPLTDSSENNWQDAFNALELLKYKSPLVNSHITKAMNDLTNRSIDFKRAIIELIYSNYPKIFKHQAYNLFAQSTDAKLLAMCANYILQCHVSADTIHTLLQKTRQQLQQDTGNPILEQLQYQLVHYAKPDAIPDVKSFLQKNYLPGQVLLISFQRKNRNYPGLVIVRDGNGNFVKDDSTNLLFAVPQLARSMSNMPGYISNGNTPEGIFKMDGFDVSRSSFIGPTPNIQLSMPFETNEKHFFNNDAITDTSWNINLYKKLLPKNWQDYFPIYQTYYAGKAGRTEIIAHGTTINPEYYRTQPYYPIPPTQGCLSTTEIWNENTGHQTRSDQRALINAMLKAGGSHGYTIVININDEQRPVLLADVLPYF
ncbi:MAG: hypothetical protein JSU03_06960 [Bacteroidetes bacterium]|nr:hypothetical protein [Bacteroidota bacterium]MBS1757002.1 hypothetical protein [Bacteroidota bacterium]